MYRAIIVTVGVIAVFAVVVIVTLMVRNKQKKKNVNPYIDEFKEYQEDMMTNGYDVSYDSQPTNLEKAEDLIYQARAKMSDVNFDLDEPESKPDPCSIWITNKKLLVERRGKEKKMYAFELDLLWEFEYDLEKGAHTFLFQYKTDCFKFETKDIYALALIELKTRAKKQD